MKSGTKECKGVQLLLGANNQVAIESDSAVEVTQYKGGWDFEGKGRSQGADCRREKSAD